MKFEKNDEVIVVSRAFDTGVTKYYESNALIIEKCFPGFPWDYEIEMYDGAHFFAMEDQICSFKEFYYGLHLEGKECECGAKHIKGQEHFHSTWCPRYAQPQSI